MLGFGGPRGLPATSRRSLSPTKSGSPVRLTSHTSTLVWSRVRRVQKKTRRCSFFTKATKSSTIHRCASERFGHQRRRARSKQWTTQLSHCNVHSHRTLQKVQTSKRNKRRRQQEHAQYAQRTHTLAPANRLAPSTHGRSREWRRSASQTWSSACRSTPISHSSAASETSASRCGRQGNWATERRKSGGLTIACCDQTKPGS